MLPNYPMAHCVSCSGGAALLSPRPPSLMVLNEPETSLHPPDLVAPLASMIRAAARATQVVVVTHSQAMRGHLDVEGSSEIELYKQWGETLVVDQTMLTTPPWDWGGKR